MATIKKRIWKNRHGERKEAWQLRYVDAQGVERSKQFAKKGDASAYLRKIGWELSQGTHTPDSTSITISRAADLWLNTARSKGLERSTMKQYDEWVRLHINPLLGDRKLSQLTMPMVEAFKDCLLETRSPAMVGKILGGLSSLIAECQRRGLIAQNVARGVRVVRSRRDRKRVVIPTKPDLRLMLDGAKAIEDENPALLPMLLTVALTGLRSSELRGLRAADVDLKGCQINVCQRADAWGEISVPKSAAGFRTIPIPAALVTELRKWMLRAPPSKLGLLFPNSEGGARLHSNLLNREYWPLQVAAGLVRPATQRGGNGQLEEKVATDGVQVMRAMYDFHALRHYAASSWIKQKVDLKRLTTWLGHSSVQITLDTYGHLIKDEEGDAAIAAAVAAELLI